VLNLQVADWRIECDPGATRAAYASLPVGTGCSCDQCRNFDAAEGKTFPPEFVALAASIGIDPVKPSELLHWCREPSGLYLTGGWFHFVGRIVSGADSHENEDGTGIVRQVALASGVEVGVSRHARLVPKTFAGLSISQLEFQTRVPWVLSDAEPAP
jgi:hypothetical protein